MSVLLRLASSADFSELLETASPTVFICDAVTLIVGALVGLVVGALVGFLVVGAVVDFIVTLIVGVLVGYEVGAAVGMLVPCEVGAVALLAASAAHIRHADRMAIWGL